MAFVKLVILLLLPSLYTVNGKAISKRYVEHLLREGYTSDCGDDEPPKYIAPSSLPTIIAARADLSPTSVRYAEPAEIIAEPKPSAAFGYQFTVPIPPTPLRIETAKADDCLHSEPITAYPAPVELPAPAAAITTDCSDIPTLPLAPPPAPEYSAAPIPESPPAELPLTPPIELPTGHENAIITEPLKSGDCGLEVAAAPIYDEPPPAQQPLELPPPPPITIEAPAPPQLDEGCGGKILPLEYTGWEGKALGTPTYGAKFLPPILEGFHGKALAGARYGMPQNWELSKHWLPTEFEWKRSLHRMALDLPKGEWHLPMYRTGVSHPIQSTGLEWKRDLAHPMDFDLPKGEWYLPMTYRTGVSHPCQSDEAKSK